jgi:hypothetical protein
VASSLGIRDASLGPPRAAHEVLPSAVGCHVLDGVGSIVLVELVLPVVRHLAQNPDVPVVAHDRAPPGSETGSKTAAASGSG